VLKNRKCKECAAALVIHTSGPHSCLKQPFSNQLYEDTIELPILHGRPTVLDDEGLVVIYQLDSGFSGRSFAVTNNGTSTLKFTHDCRESQNLQSNQSSLITTQIIPPGETKVTHHCGPIDQSKTWTLRQKRSWEFV
jgi:hypothetical protein